VPSLRYRFDFAEMSLLDDNPMRDDNYRIERSYACDKVKSFAPGVRFRWPTVLIVAGIAGCFPFTISSAPEGCLRVILIIFLGFLISRWWTNPLAQLSLAFTLSLLSSLICILSNSLHDGLNWFVLLYHAVAAAGADDPYVRVQLGIVFCPVWATVLCAIVFMTLLKPTAVNKAENEKRQAAK